MTDYKALIQPAEVKARVFLNTIAGFKIENDGDKEAACRLLKEVSEYNKALTAQRQELTKPLKDEARAIEAEYKKPLDFLKEADATIRAKINAYLTAERKRIEAEALAAKQAAEDEALRQAEALEKDKAAAAQYDEVTAAAIRESIDEKQNSLIEATAKQEKINQSSETAVVRQIWTFRVTDISKVPAEFLLINEKAVREAIRSGVREISGISIFSESQVAIK